MSLYACGVQGVLFAWFRVSCCVNYILIARLVAEEGAVESSVNILGKPATFTLHAVRHQKHRSLQTSRTTSKKEKQQCINTVVPHQILLFLLLQTVTSCNSAIVFLYIVYIYIHTLIVLDQKPITSVLTQVQCI
jgi:hypothetical protein